MNIVLISEHYAPLTGGTATYASKVSQYLAANPSLNVRLIVPSESEKGKIEVKKENGLEVWYIGIGEALRTQTTKEAKRFFCVTANDTLKQIVAQNAIDVVLVMFGFLMIELLDTSFLLQKNIKTVATVHNIPPKECANSWQGDLFYRYWIDNLKKIAIGIKNRSRLRKQHWDAFIVPSNIVKEELHTLFPQHVIQAIGHGAMIDRIPLKEVASQKQYTLLTVGGLVPHKSQHLIPEVVEMLNEKKIAVIWNIVGPQRNRHYVAALQSDIVKKGLSAQIKLHNNIPYSHLEELYSKADIYVQPSKEEGFCMTALDGAMYGLPIVGTNAGAIPEIIQTFGGVLVDVNAKSIAQGIISIITNPSVVTPNVTLANNKYNWENAAKETLSLFQQILQRT